MDAAARTPMPGPELVEIYSPGDLYEAEAIRAALVAEGIPCQIEGAAAAGAYVGIDAEPLLQILVRAEDAKRARGIVDAGDWPRYT